MKKCNIYKSVLFLLILGIFLRVVSVASVHMDRNRKILYNHSATCLFYEPDNSIDVLAIGDSNTYSAVCPLLWWEEYGITGYSWGEPSQRIAETYEYLKNIYKKQNPAVVMIEAGNIFRDKTDADNLNSIVKANISSVFPVVTYHKSLDPDRLPNLVTDGHSMTKGYYVRLEKRKAQRNKDSMNRTKEYQPLHPISRWELKRCINLCRKHGSNVILFSVPSCKGWSYKKHNTIEREAMENQVPYLDLNLDFEDQMDWKEDSCDGGDHLNVEGAEKVTHYLGRYLCDHYSLADHRKEDGYDRWDRDLEDYKRILSDPKGIPEE